MKKNEDCNLKLIEQLEKKIAESDEKICNLREFNCDLLEASLIF